MSLSQVDREPNLETLNQRARLALLHRILHSEGYRDGTNAGHISQRLEDGTILITPDEWAWDEMRASYLAHIDAEGNVIEGDWTVNKAASTLHLALHSQRQDVEVAVHHHPEWALVWAATHRLPPIYDQLSALTKDDLILYDDFRGNVTTEDVAVENVRAMEGSTKALLANHGVFVVGHTVPQVHLRCISLEHRCKLAYKVETLGGGVAVRPEVRAKLSGRVDDGYIWPNNFESAARREMRKDSSVTL